tara:strand:+ start:327 stop:743 length:417 start_codon:yes stop_codon:yes gene_type:complete
MLQIFLMFYNYSMDKLLNILTYVIGFIFLLMGLQWLIDPTSAAAGLGMSLLSGHGLSTQIGDLSSFFLVVGVFTLCAAVKENTVWLYTPIALFAFAAVSRLVAFIFHDAALSTDKIIVELVLAGFLFFLAKRKDNSFS